MSNSNTNTTNSGDPLRPTDMCVLRHVSLYQLTFREALASAIFSEADDPENAAANALAALTKRGLLRDSHGDKPLAFTRMTRKHRYYLLGPKAAKVLNVPKERKQTPREDALRTRLGILWFCTLGSRGRAHRLEQSDKRELHGSDAPHHNVAMAAAREDDGPVVYQLLVASSAAKHAVKAGRDAFDRALQKPGLRSFVESGDYGFAVLAETEQKVADVSELLSKPIGKKPPLINQARFISALGPSPQTFELGLKSLQ